MRSSSALLAAAVFVLSCPVRAQQAQGWNVERFYPSAAGGGWFVMDALDMHGGLGGAVSLATSYALNPLRVGSGPSEIRVVSDEATADIGVAATYDRFRIYMLFSKPLVIDGQSGTYGSYTYTGPAVDLGTSPDLVSDVGFGFDARIVGDPKGPFRFGVGAQFYVPNGSPPSPLPPAADYDTDLLVRLMLRALFAGDTRFITWAAQLGVHLRFRDDSPTPGGVNGSELLFGAAIGARLPIRHEGRPTNLAVVVGPEMWGETSFLGFFQPSTTGLEALLTGRLETTSDTGIQWRVKLGLGGGLIPEFGAPEFRMVAGVEMFGAQPKKR